MSWVIVAAMTVFGLVALVGLFMVSRTKGEYWKDLIEEQFPVLVGLPMAAFAALFLTVVLRITSGPIEFEAGPIRFKGGSAPIVFWVLCFLAITLAIKMLWLDAETSVAWVERATP